MSPPEAETETETRPTTTTIRVSQPVFSDAGSPSSGRADRVTSMDLRSHPLLQRFGSSGEESATPGAQAGLGQDQQPRASSMRRSKTELVLMNRTSSFSRIVFELNDELTAEKKAKQSAAAAADGSPLKQSGLFFTRLGILLSRSSGRDKFAQFLQYGSIFWGNQALIPTSQDPDAPWRNLEESMSSGRKLLRLFKWIKEFERAHRSFWVGDDVAAMVKASTLRAVVARVLGTFMHTFSFAYYLFDNILYCSQIGLINRPMFLDQVAFRQELRAVQHPVPDYAAISLMQTRNRIDQEMRAVVKQREARLKDWRNYSSLARLLLCCVYCTLQINTVAVERRRVETELVRLREAAARAREEMLASPDTAAAVAGDDAGYDTEGSVNTVTTTSMSFSVPDFVSIRELKARLSMLADVRKDNLDEIYTAICNLVILLNRLEFGVFKRTPAWVVGVCGMIAAIIGLEKNWPSLKEKKSSSGSSSSASTPSGGGKGAGSTKPPPGTTLGGE